MEKEDEEFSTGFLEAEVPMRALSVAIRVSMNMEEMSVEKRQGET